MIDRMQLERDAHTVISAEILGSILAPEARPKEKCRHCGGVGAFGPKMICDLCKGSGQLPAPVSF